jgi:hypothetical protein
MFHIHIEPQAYSQILYIIPYCYMITHLLVPN